MFSRGKEDNITLPEIVSKISESEILYHYLGVTEIPCVINSPLREDRNPSFGLYSLDGEHVFYRDFSTKDTGGTFTLFSRLWGINFQEVLNRIYKELIQNNYTTHTIVGKQAQVRSIKNLDNDTTLDVKVRDWKDYDLEYWGSYGITLEWLQWAEVYPISHKFVTKFCRTYTFPADKYAYVYVEHKEGRTTLKVYQPFNKNGFKWSNKHDRSVVSLWTKIPEYGSKVVICSSLKDALTLSANTNIPALAIQGEGYVMSDTAINELKRRFTKQYIILDNDKAGIDDAAKLSASTGFINLVIPPFDGGKDLSDFRRLFGKEKFIELIKTLFKNES